MSKRVALITGASRGIGRSTAVELAKQNMDIVIHYNGNKEKALETEELCKKNGAHTLVLQADIAQEPECKKLVEKTIEHFGHLDVLVNNAGITKDGLFIRMKEEDYDLVLDTNLKGSFFVSKYAVSTMLKQKYGRIVNISSVSGVGGNSGQANYAASKAALLGLTKSLAKELGKKGILVNAIAPGFVETDMTSVLSDTVKEAILGQVPVGFMAKPEDIAHVVAFFSSEENRYITGQVLRVDGGMSI